MVRYYTLEYWVDDGWYVGRLREVPGVFSQGVSLQELEENIRDAYQQVGKKHDTGMNTKNKRNPPLWRDWLPSQRGIADESQRNHLATERR
jgi:hypothetical protein